MEKQIKASRRDFERPASLCLAANVGEVGTVERTGFRARFLQRRDRLGTVQVRNHIEKVHGRVYLRADQRRLDAVVHRHDHRALEFAGLECGRQHAWHATNLAAQRELTEELDTG